MYMRFDPFRNIDRLTHDVLGVPRLPQAMPMDCYRDGNTFVLHFDLPGIDTSTLEVTEEHSTLTVHAERHAPRLEDAAYLVAERATGSYSRQFVVGSGLDLDAITAVYHDGVLTLTIPVREETKPRRIDVDRAGDSGTDLPGYNRPAIDQPAANQRQSSTR
jgi:HSP20 family protein